MASGIWNIAIGGLMLVGGLSGKMALFGTSSSGLLAAVGAGVLGLGVYQMVRNKRG